MSTAQQTEQTFTLYMRKPGAKSWHAAARGKSWEVAVLTGENMHATYGYEYRTEVEAS